MRRAWWIFAFAAACGDGAGPLVPASIEAASGVEVSEVVGSSVELQVRLTTEAGAPVAGERVSWSIAAGEAELSHDRSFTDAEGLARSTLRLGDRSGEISVLASARELAPIRLTVTALPTDPVAVAVWAGDNQAALVGTGLPAPLVAAAVDRFGNRVPGTPIVFQTDEGTLQSDPMSGTDGLLEAVWTLGEDPGEQIATARLSDHGAPAVFRAVAVPGPPAAVTKLRGDIQHGAPGSTLRNPLVVRVTDPFGNPMPNATVSFSSPQGGSFQPASSVTRASGETETVWTLGGDTTVSVNHNAVASAGEGVEATFLAVARDPCIGAEYALETSHAGELGPGDCQLPELLGDTSYLDLLSFTLEAQALYELELASGDFVPYVLLIPSLAQAWGRGGDRARLLVLAAAGSYELAATSTTPVSGAYTLSSRSLPDLLEGCPEDLPWLLGTIQTQQTLAPDDCEFFGGVPADFYSFSLQGGESATLTVISDLFDPVLTLYVLANSGYTRVVADTGIAGETEATVDRTAPQFGFYLAMVSTSTPGGQGDYNFDLGRVAGSNPPASVQSSSPVSPVLPPASLFRLNIISNVSTVCPICP